MAEAKQASGGNLTKEPEQPKENSATEEKTAEEPKKKGEPPKEEPKETQKKNSEEEIPKEELSIEQKPEVEPKKEEGKPKEDEKKPEEKEDQKEEAPKEEEKSKDPETANKEPESDKPKQDATTDAEKLSQEEAQDETSKKKETPKEEEEPKKLSFKDNLAAKLSGQMGGPKQNADFKANLAARLGGGMMLGMPKPKPTEEDLEKQKLEEEKKRKEEEELDKAPAAVIVHAKKVARVGGRRPASRKGFKKVERKPEESVAITVTEAVSKVADKEEDKKADAKIDSKKVEIADEAKEVDKPKKIKASKAEAEREEEQKRNRHTETSDSHKADFQLFDDDEDDDDEDDLQVAAGGDKTSFYFDPAQVQRLKLLYKGLDVLIHTRKDVKKANLLYVEKDDGGYFMWGKKKACQFPLVSITKLFMGRQTQNWSSKLDQEDVLPRLNFFSISSKDKELNIECATDALVAEWISGLKEVCKVFDHSVAIVEFVAKAVPLSKLANIKHQKSKAKISHENLNLTAVPFEIFSQEIAIRRSGGVPPKLGSSGYPLPEGSSVTAHQTSMTLGDGTYVYADGSTRTKDGVSMPGYNNFEKDVLSWLRSSVPAQAKLLEDGCYQLVNGAILFPSWSVTMSNGQIRLWDGTTVSPKWRLAAFGAKLLPTGSLLLPNGAIKYPDGSCLLDNTLQFANGNCLEITHGDNYGDRISFADQEIKLPSGATIENQTVTLPDGSQVPTKWRVPPIKEISSFQLPSVPKPLQDVDAESVFVAAQHGNMPALVELIKAGADINATDSEGNTPLHLTSSLEVATHLAKLGADLQAKNKAGDMACTIFVNDDRKKLEEATAATSRPSNQVGRKRSLRFALDTGDTAMRVNITLTNFPKPKEKTGKFVVGFFGRRSEASDADFFAHLAHTEPLAWKKELQTPSIRLPLVPGLLVRLCVFETQGEELDQEDLYGQYIGHADTNMEEVYSMEKTFQMANQLNKEYAKNLIALNSRVKLAPDKRVLKKKAVVAAHEPEASAKTVRIQVTMACKGLPESLPGCMVALFAQSQTDDPSQNLAFKYLGHTEWTQTKEFKFQQKILVKHTLEEAEEDDNDEENPPRMLRLGIYKNPKKLSKDNLVGHAIVSLRNLLVRNSRPDIEEYYPIENQFDDNANSAIKKAGTSVGVYLRVLADEEGAAATESTGTAGARLVSRPSISTSVAVEGLGEKDFNKGHYVVVGWMNRPMKDGKFEQTFAGLSDFLPNSNSTSLQFKKEIGARDVDGGSNIIFALHHTKEVTDNLKNLPLDKAIAHCALSLDDVVRSLQYDGGWKEFAVESKGGKKSTTVKFRVNCQLYGTIEAQVACYNLPKGHNRNFLGARCNPVVAVYRNGEEIARTVQLKDTTNPVFPKHLLFPLKLEDPYHNLEFRVFDNDSVSSDKLKLQYLLGKAVIPELRTIVSKNSVYSFTLGSSNEDTQAKFDANGSTIDLRGKFLPPGGIRSYGRGMEETKLEKHSGFLGKTRYGGIRTKWDTRYVTIDNGLLSWWKKTKNAADQEKAQPKGNIPVRDATIRKYLNLHGSHYAFSVTPALSERTYFWEAQQHVDRDKWITHIVAHGGLLQENFSASGDQRTIADSYLSGKPN